MSLKYESIAKEATEMCTRYLLGSETDDVFVESIKLYQMKIDAIKFQEAMEKNQNKPLMPKVNGDALNRLLSEGDDFTFTQEIIDYSLEEDEDDWSEFLGWKVSTESHGYHHHDGQIVEYDVFFESPEGHVYVASDEHCLMIGWDFSGDVEFS